MASVSRAIATSKTPLRLLTPNFNKNVLEIVKAMWAFIMGDSLMSQYIWIGRGWDHPESSKEHGTGRAVDIIITERVGMMRTAKEFVAGKKLVDTLIKHGRTLRIQWVLFSLDGVTTWSYNMDRGTWKKLSRRGDNPSANHVDHIHVYFKSDAVLPFGFSFGGKTTKSVPKVTSEPVPAALRKGSTGARVEALQQGLNKVFPTYRRFIAPKGQLLTVDGVFGDHTDRWVREYQRRAGLTVDGIVDAKTAASLHRHGVKF